MQKKNRGMLKYIMAVLVLVSAVVLGVGAREPETVDASLLGVEPVKGGKVISTNVEQGDSGANGSVVVGSVVTGSAVSGPAVTGSAVSGQALTGSAVDGEPQNPRFVNTLYGTVEGKKTSKAYMWLGVPYGKTERWKAPTAPDMWSRVRSCKKSKTGKGDDCLFVNIYKPVNDTESTTAGSTATDSTATDSAITGSTTTDSTEKIPVMVFLHGGGNVGGSANRNFSTFVEETGVIVVSVEFRQGAFGWFNSRGLLTGDKMTDGGNFAMLDIKLALEWVRDNIGAFGGDSRNVTLSGFSAGARDSLNCLISPVMTGLFQKMISFSGGMTTCSIKEGRSWSNDKLARVLVRRGRFGNKKRALKYVKGLSRKKLNKLLYSLTDSEIKNMVSSTSLRLTTFPQCFRDGAVIPKDGFECLEYGQYNRVPMIIGSNNSEFANVSYKTMQRILIKNPKTFKNKNQFYTLLKKAKDYGSKLQSSFYLEQLASKVARDPYHQDVYTYRFKWGENGSVVGSNYAKYVGAIHGMDVDFLLGRYKKGENATSHKIYNKSNLAGREKLSSVMRQYMRNFLYTGNPNGTDAGGNPLTVWKKWSRAAGSSRIMTFSATKTRAKAAMTSKCINRAAVRRKMKRNLTKKSYKLFKTRILNDRFFM